MKYQTKERKTSQRPNSVPGSVRLAWAPQLFQKSFLHTLDFPPFQQKLGYFGNPNWSVLRCIVRWPYSFKRR